MKKNSFSHLPASRRKFLRQLTLGSGALAFGAPLIANTPLIIRKPAKKLGIALVGLGNYATNQLAPSLQDTEHCYLAGIVTGTKEKEAKWIEKYNIPTKNIYNYDNFDQIANNDDIDIVYVVLPNSMHAEYTIRAAKAGKHVICEKPMGLSVKECEDMIAACKANKVKLSIGYRLHFDPHHMEIIKLPKEKPFGAVKYVNAEFGFRIGDPTQWRLRKNLAGGGAIMDVGVYCIQGARYATGEEPIAVTAREFKTDPVKFAEVDETVTWEMEFPSGAIANCTTSYAFSTNRLHVGMEKGTAEVQPSYSYRGLAGHVNRKLMDFPVKRQQASQMDNFAQVINNGGESEVSGQEGLLDLKVVEAMYKSIKKKGKRVKV